MSAIVKRRKREVLWPAATFMALLALAFFLWKVSINDLEDDLKNQIQLSGKLAAQEFRSIMKNDINWLENLKRRLEATDGDYFNYWEKDADIILSQNTSFKFVEWIDSSMVIRKIRPLEGNEAVVNLDISQIEYRRAEWLKHMEDSSTNITPWAKLTQGGNAFLVDVPVYFRGQFQGTITAGMDFTDNFNKFAGSLSNYAIEIRDEKGTIFYAHNLHENYTPKKEFIYSSLIPIDIKDQQDWAFLMFPTSENFIEQNDLLSSYVFFFGTVLSFLVGLLIYFFIKARNENARVIEANYSLTVLNKKLHRERRRAEKASLAKTEFLSNMSHEIRTPLNAILGFIQVLKNNNKNSQDKEYLELMNESSKNLLSLVNDILEIDRIESGQMTLKKDRFQPLKKVQGLANLYKSTIKKKHLYIKSHIAKTSEYYVNGDESKFIQVITNLLKNAIKFTSTGGIEIFYTETKVGSHLEVTVVIKDTGIGIPKNKQEAIFDRFTQLDSSVKKKHEGGGLGLAISSYLVKLMGGTIELKSEPDKGSEFTVKVPLLLSDDQYSETPDVKQTVVHFTDLPVLIVDDNKINVLVLSKMLEQVGIHAQVAENGFQAIEMVKNHSFKLIMMDIHMPEMDGYEATKRILKINPEVVIFGFSANVTREAIDKALQTGMHDYITKPYTQERLRELLSLHFSMNQST